jgi:tetratricopeptide (TPR) repeat protein
MGRFAISKAASAIALAIAGLSQAVFADNAAPLPAAAPAPAAAVVAAAPAPAPVDAVAVQKQADDLIRQGQYSAAYDLLAPLEDDLAGKPDYDYALGLSALESGKPSNAAFAFERCLTVDPRNGPCRVQMARTHLALGEQQSAQREFNTIQKYSPPPEVQALVSKYLGGIAELQRQQKRQFNAYVEGGVGADSNINRATSQSQIAIPFGGAVLPFDLGHDAVKQHDNLVQSMAGFSGAYAINDQWALVADGDFTDQVYPNKALFNNRFGGLNAGTVYKHGASQYTLKAQAQLYDTHNDLYRRLWGGIAQYAYSYSQSRQLTTYLQSNRLAYAASGKANVNDAGQPILDGSGLPTYQPNRDVDRRTIGAAYSTALAASYTPVVFVGGYFGQEAVLDDTQKQFGQRFIGLRAGGTLYFSNKLSLNSVLSGESRRYGQTPLGSLLDPGISRQDTQFDASLGLSYTLSPALSLRPSYGYTHVSSNTQLNKYTRSVFSLDLRYEM